MHHSLFASFSLCLNELFFFRLAAFSECRDLRQLLVFFLCPALFLFSIRFYVVSHFSSRKVFHSRLIGSEHTIRPQHFFSYTETVKEVSLILDESHLFGFPENTLNVCPVIWRAVQIEPGESGLGKSNGSLPFSLEVD
jgi:hypothetical protein